MKSVEEWMKIGWKGIAPSKPQVRQLIEDVQKDATSCPVVTGIQAMTLEDYFAGQSLAHMQMGNSWSDNPDYWENVARSAYVAAAAMIAEKREREKGGV